MPNSKLAFSFLIYAKFRKLETDFEIIEVLGVRCILITSYDILKIKTAY